MLCAAIHELKLLMNHSHFLLKQWRVHGLTVNFKGMLLVKIQGDNVNPFPRLAHILLFWPACPGCIDKGSRHYSAMICVSVVREAIAGATDSILGLSDTDTQSLRSWRRLEWTCSPAHKGMQASQWGHSAWVLKSSLVLLAHPGWKAVTRFYKIINLNAAGYGMWKSVVLMVWCLHVSENCIEVCRFLNKKLALVSRKRVTSLQEEKQIN